MVMAGTHWGSVAQLGLIVFFIIVLVSAIKNR
jgi:hypothetical protein